MNEEAVKAVADEVYATLEAASRFATKEEMADIAFKVDGVCREIFGVDVWRNVTYEGL